MTSLVGFFIEKRRKNQSAAFSLFLFILLLTARSIIPSRFHNDFQEIIS
jgi:hypothetical protein